MQREDGRPLQVLPGLHDLGQVWEFADRVAVMHSGRIAAEGPPHDVLASPVISAVFGVRLLRQGGPRFVLSKGEAMSEGWQYGILAALAISACAVVTGARRVFSCWAGHSVSLCREPSSAMAERAART